MDKSMMDNPVLVETALLGRGLSSLDNSLVQYLWPDRDIVLPYVQKGLIKCKPIDEFVELRNHSDWFRIDAKSILDLKANPINGYLTASALIKLASPLAIVVTAGMGGVTGERISQDLVAVAEKPVVFISSGFKDLIDARGSLEYLRSQGVKVLGWKRPIYDGFLFNREPHGLDGVVDEDSIKDISLNKSQGILIFNLLPEELRLKDEKLIELAGEKMNTATKRGEDFHPVVNKLLDEETKGVSSFIQFLALVANLNLALKINAQLGGLRNGLNRLAGK